MDNAKQIADGAIKAHELKYHTRPNKAGRTKPKQYNTILAHWNSFKKKGKWKTHTKITPDIQQAIKNALVGWTVEDICDAITNFAKIVQDQEFTWTYAKWGLYEFLTRREQDDRKMYRWWRFHPNRFVEDDWITQRTRERRAEETKRYYESMKNCNEQKLIAAYRENKSNLNWLIDKIRPEIKALATKPATKHEED